MPAGKRRRKPTAKAQAAKVARTTATRSAAGRTRSTAASTRANANRRSTVPSEEPIEPNPNAGEDEGEQDVGLVIDLDMLDLVSAAKKKVEAKDIDKALRSKKTEVNAALRKLIVGSNEQLRNELQDKNVLQLAAYAQTHSTNHILLTLHTSRREAFRVAARSTKRKPSAGGAAGPESKPA